MPKVLFVTYFYTCMVIGYEDVRTSFFLHFYHFFNFFVSGWQYFIACFETRLTTMIYDFIIFETHCWYQFYVPLIRTLAIKYAVVGFLWINMVRNIIWHIICVTLFCKCSLLWFYLTHPYVLNTQMVDVNSCRHYLDASSHSPSLRKALV